MKLKKLSEIIKSIGTPNKDDTLLGVFNGKTAQKSVEDILKATDFTQLQNLPFTLITKPEISTTELKIGTYLVAYKEVDVINKSGDTVAYALPKGTIINIKGSVITIVDGLIYYTSDIEEDWCTDWLVSTDDLAKTQIRGEKYDISLFKSGAYEVAVDSTKITNKTAELCSLPKGTELFISQNGNSLSAIVINGDGMSFVEDITNADNWNLSEYCPAITEVYKIVDESVTDAINRLNFNDKDISKAIVIFQNSDGMNTTLYLSAFAKNVMESLESKQDKITLGDGLKWDSNGKLCLDIENGDNLKYGTSITAEETNENEVTENE